MDKSTTPDFDQPVAYEAPTVTDYGDLADVTAGTQTGNFTDFSFPSNTPRGDLTFS